MTNMGNCTRRIQWYHFGPSRVTPNKRSKPQFWDTAYISKVNGAMRVKSDAHVAMNKNSYTPCRNIFLGVAGNSAPILPVI